MGFLDDVKKQAADLADKAEDFASDHKEQALTGIAKAADFVDDKTGGKHADKVAKVQEKAEGLVEKAVKD